jgi:hypothetical protein
MKNLLLIATVLWAGFTVNAQTNYEWAKTVGGLNYDNGNAITLDNAGNVYVTGRFQKYVGVPADFDPGNGVYNLEAIGQYDAFILKLDPLGNLIWAKNIGSSGGVSEGNAISVDADGNVYTVGSFSYDADFDPSPTATFFLSAPYIIFNNPTNIFALKLNSNGDFVWAKSIGGTFSDVATALVLDATSNLYIAGTFTGTVDFDPNSGISELVGAGSKDGFVLKLDTSGNYVWAKAISGSNNDEVTAITLDNSENVFATGQFSATTDFDPSTATYKIAGIGSFVLKLNSEGVFQMAKGFVSEGSVQANAIKIDATGNIYTTGVHQGITDFDPSTASYNFTQTPFASDMFLSKLNSDGDFVWAKKIYSSAADNSKGLALDPSGNIYIVGTAYGSTLRIENESTIITPGVSGDYLTVLKFNPEGNLLGTNFIGSSIFGNGIALDSNQDVYTVGTSFLAGSFENVFISKMKINLFSLSVSDEIILKNNFKIYPNPSSGNFNIEVAENLISSKATIYNLLGQKIKDFSLKATITNQSLNKGMYLLEIDKDGSKTTKKLIVN